MERRKIAFSLNSALPEFNKFLLDFFTLFDLRLIRTLLYDFLNLVINAFNSGLADMVQEKGSRQRATAVGLCCTVARTMHVHQSAISLKEKISSVMCFIAYIIC